MKINIIDSKARELPGVFGIDPFRFNKLSKMVEDTSKGDKDRVSEDMEKICNECETTEEVVACIHQYSFAFAIKTIGLSLFGGKIK